MNIQPITHGSISKPDQEHIMIMKKLYAMGNVPSGNKETDKAKLHEIELREAKINPTSQVKFLTVSKLELEKILNKKNENNIGNFQSEMQEQKMNTEQAMLQDSTLGQKLLGEQLMLVLEMKKKKVII